MKGEVTSHHILHLTLILCSCPDGLTHLLFQQTVRGNRLTFWNKLCYAIGGAPYQITGSVLGFFLQIFLLDVAQVKPVLFSDSQISSSVRPL